MRVFSRSCAQPPATSNSMHNTGLSTLPYDLLLNIAHYLDLSDVHSLHLTCKALYDFSTTRPVYRKLANDLLRRCRALPLKGFQRITDLTTDQLIRAVNKATRYETAWTHRAPRPGGDPSTEPNSCSNYMDVSVGANTSTSTSTRGAKNDKRWYKVVSAPPGEEVDWLSPITSSYTLCATKSGKVVCWDVQADQCLAQWCPGERWELWKCRVEFEERTVFFTMARVLVPSYDDKRMMEFVLMKLTFSDGPSGESSVEKPVFEHVTEFRTTGVVMNVFLLDPSERLLAAFVWVSQSNTIGLYALMDWDKPEYVFIDTGIECVMSSNWSCILFEQHIVIHCEESEAAFQHFYPLSLLQKYTKTLSVDRSTPVISKRVPPSRTISKKFVFPLLFDSDSDIFDTVTPPSANTGTGIPIHVGGASSISTAVTLVDNNNNNSNSSNSNSNNNPFPFPPWYPESAHFVRQWWPSLPGIPRVSCTVVLLAYHDQVTHRTQFVLAQHYFRVPLNHAEWVHGPAGVSKGLVRGSSTATTTIAHSHSQDAQDDALMHVWYVSTPFEVVRVVDGPEEDDENGERPRPLVAVDFGHAVWIEYVDVDEERPGDGDAKWLRFVTFPPFRDESGGGVGCCEGEMRTLEVPEELDLGLVETINIDQSQGAVILSDRNGRIFILCYE